MKSKKTGFFSIFRILFCYLRNSTMKNKLNAAFRIKDQNIEAANSTPLIDVSRHVNDKSIPKYRKESPNGR